jgi:hypothetical protein
MLFILILFSASFAHGIWVPQWVRNGAIRALGFPVSSTCGFTRTDALVCMKKYVDLNHDGEIQENEFDYAKEHYTPPRMQKVQWAVSKLGWDYTLDVIRPACGDEHGRFTEASWMKNTKHCLPHKSDLCLFQYVCQLAEERSKNI